MKPCFKDNFSVQAADYEKFRPRYPERLFEYLAGLCREHKTAWDCATGNGQCAISLARFFDEVIATDLSQRQLDNAPPSPGVRYQLAPAEASGLEPCSIDLITVAQALHWFRLEEFWSEVRRVLQPNGIIAVWCYAFLQIDPKIDSIVSRFYSDIVGPYWDFERKLVEHGYCSISFPLAELQPPPFAIETSWSLAHLSGYLQSWSATQNFIRANGNNPVEMIATELAKVWGDPAMLRPVKWPLSMRVARNAPKTDRDGPYDPSLPLHSSFS